MKTKNKTKQKQQDISPTPFYVAHIFDDVDDTYWAHELLLKQVVDEYAPMKKKFPRNIHQLCLPKLIYKRKTSS